MSDNLVKMAESTAVEKTFTEQELSYVSSIKQKLDHNNPLSIITVDDEVTKELSNFNNEVLSKVGLADIKDLSSIIATVRDGVIEMDPKIVEQKPGFLSKIFGQAKEGIVKYREKYDTIKDRFDKIESEVQENIDKSKNQFENIQKLYDINFSQFRKLELVIAACNEELDVMKTQELVSLQKDAESGDQTAVQKLREFETQIRTMEKKIYELESSRIECIQVASAILISRDNIINNIISSVSIISNGIDAWKRDVFMVINNHDASRIASNNDQILDVKNMIKKRSADLLYDATIKTTMVSERPLTDFETLKYSNEKLIKTLEERSKIIIEKDKERVENLAKVKQLENELSKSLLIK